MYQDGLNNYYDENLNNLNDEDNSTPSINVYDVYNNHHMGYQCVTNNYDEIIRNFEFYG